MSKIFHHTVAEKGNAERHLLTHGLQYVGIFKESTAKCGLYGTQAVITRPKSGRVPCQGNGYWLERGRSALSECEQIVRPDFIGVGL
jgi:hypothetical protein